MFCMMQIVHVGTNEGKENLRCKFRWRRDIFIWEEQLEQEMYTS